MEEGKSGVVKHILLAKFKEVSEQKIEECIKQYANLVNLIPSMKSFKWGKDVSIENLHQGFTHVFESTFESTDGIAEYLGHPDHEAYGHVLRPLGECDHRRLQANCGPTQIQNGYVLGSLTVISAPPSTM